jgi:hypothetical protein
LLVVDGNGIDGFALRVGSFHVYRYGLAVGRDPAVGGEHGFAALAVDDLSLVRPHPFAGNGFILRLDDLALATLRGHRVMGRDRAIVCGGSAERHIEITAGLRDG